MRSKVSFYLKPALVRPIETVGNSELFREPLGTYKPKLQCEICSTPTAKFRSPKELKRHKKTAHGPRNQFTCPFSHGMREKTFTRDDNFRRHLREKHELVSREIDDLLRSPR
jgi:hypothetical protein